VNSLYDNFTSFSDCESIGVGPVLVKLLKETAKFPTSSDFYALDAEEQKMLGSYKSNDRQFEYERARLLIRNSLKYSGPLGKCLNGAPNWPQGLVGSLSHKDLIVALSIAKESQYLGIGLDLENISRVGWYLKDKIINDNEEILIKKNACDMNIDSATLLATVFSFKEAIFKCIFPIGETMFYFLNAEIISFSKNNSISAKLLCSPSKPTPEGFIITGNYAFLSHNNKEYVITSATLSSDLIDFSIFR